MESYNNVVLCFWGGPALNGTKASLSERPLGECALLHRHIHKVGARDRRLLPPSGAGTWRLLLPLVLYSSGVVTEAYDFVFYFYLCPAAKGKDEGWILSNSAIFLFKILLKRLLLFLSFISYVSQGSGGLLPGTIRAGP